jgi:ubiquinone/menaquinone biosynthesis C-methylase UbiE
MADKETVKEGYDAVAGRYLAARTQESADIRLLPELMVRLPGGAAVLDAGCGAGMPVAHLLSQHFRVTGIDFSMSQLRLARELVPAARFACQDMTHLAFGAATFDAICSYYAIIHVPRTEHSALLADFHRVLRPGGLALLCLGAEDLPRDVEEDYYGAQMVWSHFDAATNIGLVEAAGFTIIWARRITDAEWPASGHLFVLARRET